MDLYFWIKEEAKLPLFLIVFVLSTIVSIVLSRIGAAETPGEPSLRVISLELANNEEAKNMVNSFTPKIREKAFLNLGLDYLFLFLYPIAISLACNLLARSFDTAWVKNLGLWLSVVSLLPIIFDAVENYAIIQMLKTGVFETWANVARFSAIPKFLFAATGLIYVLIAFLAKCAGWIGSKT
jgi:hypothetical protein